MNPAQNFTLTPSIFINNWVQKDDTVELIGFVEKTHGPRDVPYINHQQVRHFSLLINNNDFKRVLVLFWNQHADHFGPLIRENVILKISRGIAKERRWVPPYYRDYAGIHGLEILVSDNSVVDLGLGQMFFPIRRLINVPLGQIHLQNGIVEISGWLKVLFADVVVEGAHFGSGVIVHRQYRLNIHVRNHVPNPALLQGVAVRVCGRYIQNRGGCPYFSVRHIADIVIDGALPRLSANALNDLGHITPR